MDRRLRGRWGEALAAEYLRKKGYSVAGMGYRTRFGEIDVIAENGKYVVFAEVKLRKNAAFAEAREFVDAGKRRRILASAELWLAENKTEKQPRFDVIEVYAPEDGSRPEINHIADAFGADY